MKRFFSNFVMFLLAVVFSGVLNAQEQLILYGLKGPSGLGMIQLFETPVFAEGLVIEVQALAAADLMAAKFLSGEASIGILPPNVAAKLASAGRPLSVAAVVGTGMLSLLTADPQVRSIKDLAGRTVEVAGQGATPDYIFRRILKYRGLEPGKQVNLSFSLAYPEIAQALIAGRVDLALLPEPFATMALLGKPSLQVVGNIQEEWALAGGEPLYPMTVLVVDSGFAKKYPQALSSIMDAYRASIEWVSSHAKEAGILAEKHNLGLKAAIATAAIPKSGYVFIPAQEAKASLEALYQAFLDSAPASIGNKLPDGDFYLNIHTR